MVIVWHDYFKYVNLNQGVIMIKNQMKSYLKKFGVITILCACLCLCGFGIKNKDTNGQKLQAIAVNSATVGVVDKLLQAQNPSKTSYSLRDSYPIVSENQTDSNYCWIYSSAKVFETALMVQKQEYVNLSETALAYLEYQNKLSTNPVAINMKGNFDTFHSLIKRDGVVYQSDFSNDIYFDISESNINNYSYVEQLTDKSLSQTASSVNLGEYEVFYNYNLSVKKTIVKKYIQNYGGLFVGIEEGAIIDKGVAQVYTTNKNEEGIKVLLNENHAVCIVGWDDSYGFLALNSWGYEVSEFYIPYDYINQYSTLCGYLFLDQDVVVKSNTASTFDDVVGYNSNIHNIFNINDEVSLTYKVPSLYNFSQIYIEIFKGSQNVTNHFSIGYDDLKKEVVFSLFDRDNLFLGGGYSVRFYEGAKTIFTKTFFVYSGTEISYFDLVTTDYLDEKVLDSSLLQSGYLTSKTSTTYYLPSTTNKYQLVFGLTDMNDRDRTHNNLSFVVGEPYIYDVGQNGTIVKPANKLAVKQVSTIGEPYKISISGLSEYKNKFVSFQIQVYSTIQTWNDVMQTYTINFFVGESSTINSSNTYAISYILDGGENSPLNVDRFPSFSDAISMTEVILQDPVQNGKNFLGWYLDKNFTQKVTKIDRNLQSDISLYAKWQESAVVNYFSTDLICQITNYHGESVEKNKQQLIYGDNIHFTYTFSPTEELLKHALVAISLNYYLNGELQNVFELKKEQEIIVLDLIKKDVLAYDLKLELSLIIDRKIVYTDTQTDNFVVLQKEITPIVSNLERVYDGNYYKPTIECAEVYDEDKASFEIEFLENSQKNVGMYIFSNIIMDNKSLQNYKIAGFEGCKLTINKKPINLVWESVVEDYNGTAQFPTYTFENMVEGDTALLVFDTQDLINAGEYTIVVNKSSLTNNNYYLESAENCIFTIKKAKLKVVIASVTDRSETDPIYRENIQDNFTIEGNFYCSREELLINITSQGSTSDKYGIYSITGTCGNSNYDVEFVNGTYTLTGYYFVYYTLPDGSVYVERVEAGCDPKGINNDVYKKAFYEVYQYSQNLANTGKDLYVIVTIKSYLVVSIFAGLVFAFATIYFFVSRKQRRNKVS